MKKDLRWGLRKMRTASLIASDRGGWLRTGRRASRIFFAHGWIGLRDRWREQQNAILPKVFASDLKKRQQYLRSLPPPSNAPNFTILTTVWRGTGPDLFIETAKSVQDQSYRDFEWVILRHGPIPEKLSSTLKELHEKNAIVLYTLEENIGISGGMRYCLERAKSAYIVPLDGDDLLTSEALSVLARHIVDKNYPNLCYTDEAVLSRSSMTPVFRAEFDPMLNFSASTLWHLISFNREEALSLGVFSNPETEYCQDWDTIMRFYTAGKRIHHIPEISYLWRQHDQSTSNSGNTYTLSHSSQKAVLSSALDRIDLLNRFQVEEFPIWRDTKEFRCRWTGDWPQACYIVLIGEETLKNSSEFGDFLQAVHIPVEHVCHIGSSPNTVNMTQLSITVQTLPQDALCWIMDGNLRPDSQWFLEETAAWFTLLQSMDFLCGNIVSECKDAVNTDEIVLEGGLMFGFNGLLGSPEAGIPPNVPGPLAMHLRPHLVDAPNPRFFAARPSALLKALQSLADEISVEEMAVRIGLYARKSGKVVGWSPLLRSHSPVFLEAINGNKIKPMLSKEEMALISNSPWYPDTMHKESPSGWTSIYSVPQVIDDAQYTLPQIGKHLTIPIDLDFTSGIEVSEIRRESGHTELLVILPKTSPDSLSGGPNTALLLASEAAKAGYGVHVLSISRPHTGTTEQIRDHIHLGLKLPLDVASRFHASYISDAVLNHSDKIMATRYDTALIARSLARKLSLKKFLYIIQDFEPMFFPWSEEHALAAASYEGDFIPVVNESLLADFIKNLRIGQFADASFRKEVLAFEPAVDRTMFYPRKGNAGKRVILFYARLESAPRNISNLGFKALSILVSEGIINPDEWEVLTMGEPSLPDIDLGGGIKTRNLPWMNFSEYVECVQAADVGLSLMLSPHTSYLPLEFAACGVSVVTSCYANKTSEVLSSISPCMIGVEANPRAIAIGLKKAIAQAAMDSRETDARLFSFPSSWGEAFASVTPTLLTFMETNESSQR